MKLIIILLIGLTIMSCSNNDKPKTEVPDTPESGIDKGVGVITNIDIGPDIDMAMAAEGEKIFVTKCSACHKLDEKYVGPPLGDVAKRRSPEWIMNMILDPTKMTKENKAANELLGQYMTQMTNQNIQQDEARKLLEYLRSVAK